MNAHIPLIQVVRRVVQPDTHLKSISLSAPVEDVLHLCEVTEAVEVISGRRKMAKEERDGRM